MSREPERPDSPKEIEAEPFRDYRTEGRKGEPLFAPGGAWFLAMIVVTAVVSIWFSDLFRPAVEYFLGPRP
jgi:hypothetical protein